MMVAFLKSRIYISNYTVLGIPCDHALWAVFNVSAAPWRDSPAHCIVQSILRY